VLGIGGDKEPDYVSKDWTGIVQVQGEDFPPVDKAAMEYNKTGKPFDGTYYTKDQPDVAAAMKTVREYMHMYLSTSYKTYNPTDFEMYYSSDKRAEYEKTGAAEDRKWFTVNQLEFTPVGDIRFRLETIDGSFQEIRVDFKADTNVKAAQSFNHHGNATIRGTLWFVNETNIWRIGDENLNFKK